MRPPRTSTSDASSDASGFWRLCIAVAALQATGIALLVFLEMSRLLALAIGASLVAMTIGLFSALYRSVGRQRTRQLEALRSDFAANVSHELRTPITNIKGYAETMLEVGFNDSQQAYKFLEIIRRNSDRLAAIVEDLLSLAWLEQPDTRRSLPRERRELGPILDAVAAQFENAASAKNIALAVNVQPTLSAPINAQLIEQAVANYVSNAIKYGAPESMVRISAAAYSENGDEEAAPRWVEIAVQDKGPGIAPDHLPRIFERFYRVDKARSRELGGTGLGLAIVKHIANVHGGRVDVESQPGKGSTFRLYLPASS